MVTNFIIKDQVAKDLERGKLSRERYDDVQASQDVFLDDLLPFDFGVSTTVEDFLAINCLPDFPAGGDNDDSSPFNDSNVSGDCSILSSELPVPDDDIAELEWVSLSMDDDIGDIDLSLFVPSTTEATKGDVDQFEPGHVSSVIDLFPCRVPAKVRNKRPRPTGASWTSIGISPLAKSSSFSTPSPIISRSLVQPVDSGIGSNEPVAKKPKKGCPSRTRVGETGLAQLQRRCTHCQVHKTPQWREGPLGPKTLCNACGVRYKSGRLFPEYRPACSPNFSSEVHSNCHRKVLEMRRRKEMGELARFKHMITSF